eukprot:scaffold10220_cov148-Cylindrotheca_fusiformis.AAC.9
MANRYDDNEGHALVGYTEPEIYFDEPEETGRTGIRGPEEEIDYSAYTTRKQHRYVDSADNRYKKLALLFCICCCCCLLIAGLITGIVLALKEDDEKPPTSPFSTSNPTPPTFLPPTFPPTINTQPTGSASPTITPVPSPAPSSVPTTSAPTVSASPTVVPPPLKVLGSEDDWDRFGAQYSFTVNDQGVYEFVYEFKHDESLPLGAEGFSGNCGFGDPLPSDPIDEQPLREPRRHFERLPDYVWKATGFQHMSLDWNACGSFPTNFATPHYDFSFFRVRPEERAYYLQCDELTKEETPVPGAIKACRKVQTTDKGKEFYILPSSLANRALIPNMPVDFVQPDSYGPAPFIGMKYYDKKNQPSSPSQWNFLDLAMSTWGGDLMMWQARVPYRLISGRDPQFNSRTLEYFQPTIQPLPDNFSVHYKQDGVIRFTMTGLSEISSIELDAMKAANPDDAPSPAVPLPDPPTCVCVAPDPTPAPSRQPSIAPSQAPSIPAFAFCSLLEAGERKTINCFLSEYQCNEAKISDCSVDCGNDQCLSTEFSESSVNCMDADSCNPEQEANAPPTTFLASQVLCSVADSCTNAEFLECTCCDGVGCPTQNSLGQTLISCFDGDLEQLCSEVIPNLGNKTCRELGNPLCTNLDVSK